MRRRRPANTVLAAVLTGAVAILVLLFHHNAHSDFKPRLQAPSNSALIKASPGSLSVGSPKAKPPERIATQLVNGINACDLYKQAFGLYDSLSAEEKNALNHPKQEIEEADAQKLFEKIQPILELMHKAAKADYADWCLGSMKFDQTSTHLLKSAQLGKLSLWAAGFQFSEEPKAALESLADRVELGRALGRHGMSGLLWEAAMERDASDLLFQNSKSITPGLAAQFKQLIQSSPLEKDAEKAMQTELEAFQDALNKGTASDSSPDPDAGVQKGEQVEQFEKEFSKMALAGDSEFDRWQDTVRAASANNPLLAANDTFAAIRSRVRESIIERSMLGAGIAIMQNGSGELGSFVEPGSQSPFLYRTTSNGFELQSRSLFRGKPIILKFENPAPAADGAGNAP